jgi:hypothetical protein
MDSFNDYQRKTERIISVIRLTPVENTARTSPTGMIFTSGYKNEACFAGFVGIAEDFTCTR